MQLHLSTGTCRTPTLLPTYCLEHCQLLYWALRALIGTQIRDELHTITATHTSVMGTEADRGRESQHSQGPVGKPTSTETIVADKSSEDGKTHEFNEQTNYVPKKTIITVRPHHRRHLGARTDCGRSSLPAQASIYWLSSIRRRLLPVCISSEMPWDLLRKCRGLPVVTSCKANNHKSSANG